MKSKTFFTKLSGIQWPNPDGSYRFEIINRYCVNGMELKLKREPENEFDKNAVGVWVPTPKGDFQIGYLGANVVRDLASYLDKGGKARITIKELTGGTIGKSRGVNLVVEVLGD